MNNTELSRARQLAGVMGFLCAVPSPWLLLFSCAAPHIFAGPLRIYRGRAPLPALTHWLLNLADHLPTSGFAWLTILSGGFLLAYLPLLVTIRRAGSVAGVALDFTLWLGLLLSVELFVVCFVAFALVLPFGFSTGKLYR